MPGTYAGGDRVSQSQPGFNSASPFRTLIAITKQVFACSAGPRLGRGLLRGLGGGMRLPPHGALRLLSGSGPSFSGFDVVSGDCTCSDGCADSSRQCLTTKNKKVIVRLEAAGSFIMQAYGPCGAALAVHQRRPPLEPARHLHWFWIRRLQSIQQVRTQPKLLSVVPTFGLAATGCSILTDAPPLHIGVQVVTGVLGAVRPPWRRLPPFLFCGSSRCRHQPVVASLKVPPYQVRYPEACILFATIDCLAGSSTMMTINHNNCCSNLSLREDLNICPECCPCPAPAIAVPVVDSLMPALPLLTEFAHCAIRLRGGGGRQRW